jgi:hypothetical protein
LISIDLIPVINNGLITINNPVDIHHSSAIDLKILCICKLKLMIMKKINRILVMLILFTAGCTSSKITTSWKAENTVPQKYNNIGAGPYQGSGQKPAAKYGKSFGR